MDFPHRRYDPLRDEWVLCSPHRAKRPWQGQTEDAPPPVPSYEPSCFLCPGNTRSNGEVNPAYEDVFVFRNDFAALLPEHHDGGISEGLFQAAPIQGECHVICYSPRHDLTMAGMTVEQLEKVIGCWSQITTDLGEKYQWVQVFENRGASMGASSPHPHGQVWTMDAVPTLVAREDAAQAKYFAEHGRPLLLDVCEEESKRGERVVTENDEWVWLVPYWAVWPFEVLLLPRRPIARLNELDQAQQTALAQILKEGLRKYDALFGVPFPYSMGWHGAPFRHEAAHWQLHAHFYPPLLRSASIRKFMVGFELLAESQRDITPEEAASRLRAL